MTDKTVKEVADMLGVTKQTVQYHLKSLPTNYTTKSDKNIIYINTTGQKALSDKINKRKQFSVDKETVETDKEPTKETVRNGKEIDYFKEQIKEKDQQIAQLLESQKQFQKLMENQQVLTLQANQKIEKLELDLKDDEDKISLTSENNKRKWTDMFKLRKWNLVIHKSFIIFNRGAVWRTLLINYLKESKQIGQIENGFFTEQLSPLWLRKYGECSNKAKLKDK